MGDALDILFGGPETYLSHHCRAGMCRACVGFYGGRTCDHDCHRGQPEARYALTRIDGLLLAAFNVDVDHATWTDDPAEALLFDTPDEAYRHVAGAMFHVEHITLWVQPGEEPTQ